MKDIEQRVTSNAAPALENRIKVAEEMWSGEVSLEHALSALLPSLSSAALPSGRQDVALLQPMWVGWLGRQSCSDLRICALESNPVVNETL